MGLRDAGDLAAVFNKVAGAQTDGLLVSTGPVLAQNQTRIAELALQSRLPSVWAYPEAVGRGGLLGYGPNRVVQARRAARYVDKILKGARPADLPIEEPTAFDFIINTKTAQALGLTIPEPVLARASEVIQ